MMNENLRQLYLSALKIPWWYARVRLPGAAASSSYEFETLLNDGFGSASQVSGREAVERRALKNMLSSEVDPIAESHRQSADQASGTNVAMRSNELAAANRNGSSGAAPESNELPPTNKTSTSSNAPVPLVGESNNAELVPNVQLHVFRVSRFLVVFSHHPEVDTAREQALLVNLVKALWGGSVMPQSAFEFHWPVFENARLPGQGLSVARNLLARLLRAQCEDVEGLILFGQSSLWDGVATGKVTQIPSWLEMDSSRLSVLVSSSLGDVLLEPAGKRHLWQHLRKFIDKC